MTGVRGTATMAPEECGTTLGAGAGVTGRSRSAVGWIMEPAMTIVRVGAVRCGWRRAISANEGAATREQRSLITCAPP